MFYEELTRLGILDEKMAPGFVLGIAVYICRRGRCGRL